MYNRYIPQPDGSYTRKSMQDPTRPRQQRSEPSQSVSKQQNCAPPVVAQETPKPKQEEKRPSPHQEKNPVGFLEQLLPKDFDTGDLFVIFLLLLMAGDSEESRANALLTLALYFIM